MWRFSTGCGGTECQSRHAEIMNYVNIIPQILDASPVCCNGWFGPGNLE